MKPSADLFELIRSLTLSEKRYFKLFAALQTKKGANNYLRLFDEIEKQVAQGTYDEASIVKTFEGEVFISYLPRVKNYLYQAIMKSLRNFHENSLIELQLKDLLKEVRILYKKGLYKQSLKTIGRGKKMAQQHEQFLDLAAFLKWERKVLEQNQEEKTFEQRMLQNIADESELYKQLTKIAELNEVKAKAFVLIKKIRDIQSHEEIKALEGIYNSPLFEKKIEFKSFTEKRLYATLRRDYYANNKEYEKAYQQSKYLIELMQDNPWFIEEEPFIFLRMHAKLISTCQDLKRYPEFLKRIDEMRLLPEKYKLGGSDAVDPYIFSSTYIRELSYYIFSGQLEKGRNVIPAVLNGIDRYQDHLQETKVLELYGKLVYLSFAAGYYEQSLEFVDHMISLPEPHPKSALHCAARMIRLVLLLEMKDANRVTAALDARNKALAQEGFNFKAEVLLFSAIDQIVKKPIPFQHSLYIELYHQMELLALDATERKPLQPFNFISWLRSKVNRTTFEHELKVRLN